MKNYVKPLAEETLVLTNDFLATSGIEVNNTKKTGVSRAEYVQDTTYADFLEKRVMMLQTS